ncbi:hypothetical protein C8J95_102372 [Elizabethkingia sp. YR214]|uniref:hypothetical protein n=1 Tax=Elizabethkingia sp. YR214 TaxID=2135667 RepID=UPI000D2F5F25|nr:hypothetical protein [Elizabethkingia sp. YR214]PUB34704.1 hypothetical protein C8J95_102372 [Elizabethkingia sp. YR214]
MTKNLLKALLWGILILSVLQSCRTEDGVITQKQVEDKRFAVFIPKSKGEKINYVQGFAYLYQNYFKENSIKEKDQKLVAKDFGVIDFRIHSQLFTLEDGTKAMVFPLRKDNSINGLIMAILENNDTSLRYTVLEENQKGYSETMQRFLAVDRENDRPIHIPASGKFPPGSSPVALAPPIKTHGISINGNGENDTNKEGDGGSSGPEKEIPGVTITVPKVPPPPVIPPPLPQDIKLPPVGPGGGCEMYENCPPYKGGGGGSGALGQSGDEWAKDHIDDRNLRDNKCANDVYQNLKSKVGLFNNLLGNFKGSSSILNLSFIIKPISSPPGTITTGQTNPENIKNGYITITMNPDALGSTDLGIATTYIHEMIHAKMFHDLVNVGWNGDNIKEINSESLPALLEAYSKELYKDENSQHRFMTEYYIPKMVAALGQFDGYNHSKADYENLAWTGLQRTKAYDALSQAKKDKITEANNTFNRKAPCGK